MLHQHRHTSRTATREMPSATQLDAVEDAFICGDWDEVLKLSRELLLGSGVQPQTSESQPNERAEEALLSMYLQSVYELGHSNELPTASSIVKSRSPLTFSSCMQWIQFLIAMGQRSDALISLNEFLQTCAAELHVNPANEDKRREYSKATELIVLQILLPFESAAAAMKYLERDTVIDDITKAHLLKVIQVSTTPESHAPTTQHATSGSVSEAAESSRRRDQSHAQSSSDNGTPNTRADPGSDLFTIGGTALAAAAIAIGAYSYRDRLREGLAQVGKGLADAKDALFDS